MILGLDPGATTGFCVYDPTSRRAIECGEFEVHHYGGTMFDLLMHEKSTSTIVIEGFGDVHAGIYPETVQAAWTGGRLIERIEIQTGKKVEEMTRHEVKKRLHAAIHGEWAVRSSKDVWAALLLLHGGKEAGIKAKTKKGIEIAPAGPIGIVTGHARAALAVAVAWSLLHPMIADEGFAP